MSPIKDPNSSVLANPFII